MFSNAFDPCAGAEQVVGLHAEGGEGSEAAAEADHDKDADGLGHLETASADRESAEEADDKRAYDVDENGGPGKAGAVSRKHLAAECITKSAANGAAERNPQIEIHLLPHLVAGPERRRHGRYWQELSAGWRA